MRIAIAGCRDITDEKKVERIIAQHIAVKDVVITGGCRGVDKIAQEYARRMFADVETFSADWDKHGKAAGPIRNREIAQNADILVAIWDGKSRGTKSMIEEAFRAGIETHVYFLT